MLDVSNIVPCPQGRGHSKSNKKTGTLRYGVHPITPRSSTIRISPEEFSNSSQGNETSSRNREIKLRKNEMKLPKNEMEVRKSFSVPHWKTKSLYGGTWQFLRRDCCIKANRCVAFGIRLRSHTEVCSLQTSPSAPCASSFLQSQDNLASKIVRLLTFATVSRRDLDRACFYRVL